MSTSSVDGAPTAGGATVVGISLKQVSFGASLLRSISSNFVGGGSALDATFEVLNALCAFDKKSGKE